jgi:hypothetical protein
MLELTAHHPTLVAVVAQVQLVVIQTLLETAFPEALELGLTFQEQELFMAVAVVDQALALVRPVVLEAAVKEVVLPKGLTQQSILVAVVVAI